MTPKRIQRKRTKGWRLPENTMIVSRPTQWGNPYHISMIQSRSKAVMAYRDYMDKIRIEQPEQYRAMLEPLRGKDLACWCALCEKHKNGKSMSEHCRNCAPCHADILLQLANQE